MKFKIFSMLVVLGMLSIMPMIYMGKINPAEFFSNASLDVDGLTKSVKKMTKKVPGMEDDGQVTMYKWKDAYGRMQFGNTPPTDAIDLEVMSVNQNHNIIDATKVPPKTNTASTGSSNFDAPNPYSVKGMKNLVNDAQGIEGMLQKRADDQQKALDRL